MIDARPPLFRLIALFALAVVPCVGACSRAPVIMVASAPAPVVLAPAPPAPPSPPPAAPSPPLAATTPPAPTPVAPPPVRPSPIVPPPVVPAPAMPPPPLSLPPVVAAALPPVEPSTAAPEPTGESPVSVFYGTSGPAGGQRAARFEVGICEITVPSGRVRSVTPLDRDKFLGYLRQHLAASRQGETFVSVPEPRVSFDEACRRAAQRWFDSGSGGVAAMFSRSRPGQWTRETADGDEAAQQLQEFVELVVSGGDATSIHLLARE